MVKKFGLGKGLDALIPVSDNSIKKESFNEGKNTILDLDIKMVQVNKEQPRKFFDESKLIELSESLKEHGIIQPLIVRKIGDGYFIIAGERRYRAAKLAGFKKIPAIIMDISDAKLLQVSLIENIQREDLNAVEQAMAMERIMKNQDITQAELAKQLGYKQSTVANKLRLLKLPDYVKNAVGRGSLSERHARALLKVPSDMLEEVFLTITNRNYTVVQTEEYISSLLNKDHHLKGVTGNSQIGVNTLKQAYDMVRQSGIDASYQVTEYGDSVKITIKIKK